jgi:hypothetical protein
MAPEDDVKPGIGQRKDTYNVGSKMINGKRHFQVLNADKSRVILSVPMDQFQGSDPRIQFDAFKGWVKNAMDVMDVASSEIKDNKDFQQKLYTHHSVNNPDKLAEIWSGKGLMGSAGKEATLRQLQDLGVKFTKKGTAYIPDFSKASSEQKAKALDIMGGVSFDGNLGQRSVAWGSLTNPEKVTTAKTSIEAPVAAQEAPVAAQEALVAAQEAFVAAIAQEEWLTEQERKSQQPRSRTYGKASPWEQDVINLGSAMSNKHNIQKHYPYLPQVNPVMPDYTPLDPSRQVAAAQSQYAMIARQMGLTSNNPSSRAAMLAGSGQTMEHVGNVISQYENANMTGVNQNEQQRSKLYTDAYTINENARSQYVDKLTTLDQNYENALRQASDITRRNYNNMTTNQQKSGWMQTMFPQYTLDPSASTIQYDPSSGLDYDGSPLGGSSRKSAYNDPGEYGQMVQNAAEKLRASGMSEDKIQQTAISWVNGRVQQMNKGHEKGNQHILGMLGQFNDPKDI